MLRTVSTSGRHAGLLVHVPVAASVVRDHGLLTIASAIHGGGVRRRADRQPGFPLRRPGAETPSSWHARRSSRPLIRLVCGRSVQSI
jgi:hypothetical protein